MGFMWQGVSSLVEKFQTQHRYLRYLLVVPCLVALAVASYKFGHYSSASGSAVNHEEAGLLRSRRDVTSPPTNTEEIATKQAGSAVYTRWGRTFCPDGANLVYAGVAGGSSHGNHGGGSNYLCLPMDPIWGTYNEAVEKGSKLHGAEYESPSGFDFRNVGGRTAQDHNVPCAVCRSQTKTSLLMIPARNRCYDDWRLEYSGYLMSEHPVHKGRTEFVCVDGMPESDPAGFRNEDGALFYNVEGVCGSLPCPPYVQRREITCAVCTK